MDWCMRKPPEYDIHITYNDIRSGIENDCQNCPVARAIQRTVGHPPVAVHEYQAFIGRYRYNLPYDVSEWIEKFDSGPLFMMPEIRFRLTNGKQTNYWITSHD